jgi:caffeoyl-CoA O-methyltransferase
MPGNLFHSELRPYLDSLVPQRHPELAAMEAYAAEHAFPIVGPAAGQFCYLMARAIGARKVFELGSGYGYSTAWFCRAVKELGGGEVHHVVWDRKLSEMAKGHLERLGFSDIVRFTVGEAVEALKRQQGEFDLIFNDIEKQDYPGSLPVIYERLRPGGMMIVDNALWSGRIFDPADGSDATEGVRTLTQLVCRDPAWAAGIVPIRDGLLVALKK